MVACRMEKESGEHLPVMLDEVVHHFAIQPNGMYVDATFGRGGHSAAILKQLGPEGRLLAIDKDLKAVAYAHKQFSKDPRFSIQQGSFAHLRDFLIRENVFGKVDGILFDLGVSSPQLDDADRGFSFMREGKLDMRMDTSSGIDAAEWIAKTPEEEMARVLWEYGEERYARRIAKAIVTARLLSPIVTTQQLAEIVMAAIPRWEKGKHPATRSFQAIRIEINQELEDLKQGLNEALEALKVGGRLVVISFHSLEDRLVKHFIQDHERGKALPSKLPLKSTAVNQRLRRLGPAMKPSSEEINVNPRARSAVLRIAEKLS